MNKPTRSQWRGYAVLCALLFVLLILFVVRNLRFRQQEQPLSLRAFDTGYELQDALDLYGDTLLAQSREEKRRYRRQYCDFGYDTSHHRHTKHTNHARENISIELNSADTMQLQLIYGIGPTFARRIVKYRALLGGFVRKEQLLEVYGMTKERYDAIAPHITVNPSTVNKLDINNATVEQLRRHPYLDYYQARAIVNYRNSGNRIASLNDLMLVNLIDEKTCTNLDGYIQFNL